MVPMVTKNRVGCPNGINNGSCNSNRNSSFNSTSRSSNFNSNSCCYLIASRIPPGGIIKNGWVDESRGRWVEGSMC